MAGLILHHGEIVGCHIASKRKSIVPKQPLLAIECLILNCWISRVNYALIQALVEVLELLGASLLPLLLFPLLWLLLEQLKLSDVLNGQREHFGVLGRFACLLFRGFQGFLINQSVNLGSCQMRVASLWVA